MFCSYVFCWLFQANQLPNLTWDLMARVGFDFTRPLGQTWLRKPLQRWQSSLKKIVLEEIHVFL